MVPRNHLWADYRYSVRRVYKRGDGISRGEAISVRGARDSAACGLPARTGRRYGLLLTRGGGRWNGGLCGVVRPRELGSGGYRRLGCAG